MPHTSPPDFDCPEVQPFRKRTPTGFFLPGFALRTPSRPRRSSSRASWGTHGLVWEALQTPGVVRVNPPLSGFHPMALRGGEAEGVPAPPPPQPTGGVHEGPPPVQNRARTPLRPPFLVERGSKRSPTLSFLYNPGTRCGWSAAPSTGPQPPTSSSGPPHRPVTQDLDETRKLGTMTTHLGRFF